MKPRLAPALLAVCLGLSAQSAQARQIDMGMASIVQNGTLVALAWVKGTGDPCRYTEYWFLSPDYIYPASPGPGETITTIQRAVPNAPFFGTPSEFFEFARSILPIGKRIVMPVVELENCGPDGFDP